MPNGKIRDHPYTDIVIHGRRVYSETADKLVQEIHELGGREEIAELLYLDFNEYKNPDIQRLELVLTDIRNRLADAKRRSNQT